MGTLSSEIAFLMSRLRVREEDLDEHFIHSSGPGGQNVNKVASCVYLVHRPTGISVKCQESRTQGGNRLLARRLICQKIEEAQHKKELRLRSQKEKERRKNRKRPQALKERILESKHRRSDRKKVRQSLDLRKGWDA